MKCPSHILHVLSILSTIVCGDETTNTFLKTSQEFLSAKDDVLPKSSNGLEIIDEPGQEPSWSAASQGILEEEEAIASTEHIETAPTEGERESLLGLDGGGAEAVAEAVPFSPNSPLVGDPFSEKGFRPLLFRQSMWPTKFHPREMSFAIAHGSLMDTRRPKDPSAIGFKVPLFTNEALNPANEEEDMDPFEIFAELFSRISPLVQVLSLDDELDVIEDAAFASVPPPSARIDRLSGETSADLSDTPNILQTLLQEVDWLRREQQALAESISFLEEAQGMNLRGSVSSRPMRREGLRGDSLQGSTRNKGFSNVEEPSQLTPEQGETKSSFDLDGKGILRAAPDRSSDFSPDLEDLEAALSDLESKYYVEFLRVLDAYGYDISTFLG